MTEERSQECERNGLHTVCLGCSCGCHGDARGSLDSPLPPTTDRERP